MNIKEWYRENSKSYIPNTSQPIVAYWDVNPFQLSWLSYVVYPTPYESPLLNKVYSSMMLDWMGGTRG